MKRICSTQTIILLLATLLFSCDRSSSSFSPSFSDGILINQIGYEQGDTKLALLRLDVQTFEVKDLSGKVHYSGTVGEYKPWHLSGDAVAVADFSDLSEPGMYYLCVNDSICSYEFSVGEHLYEDLADASIKSYYYARVGVPIEEAFGGKWHWQPGHPDTAVMIHPAAAEAHRPEGTVLSSPGGWYDAGDYGKYIVNSSITTWTILQSLALNREFHLDQDLNIPESGNELPDILDEALVNLRWMMSMQDPADGGVYHKLTTKNFDAFIMPSETDKQRFLLPKTTSAALDFASTMAAASRILREYDLDGLANDMAAAAVQAWGWAIEHPSVFYAQPEDVSTGAYPDTSFVDEWFWAASELFLLTGEKAYRDSLLSNYQSPITPKWDVVNALGMISLLTSDLREDFSDIERDFLGYADQMLERAGSSPYLISMDQFAWGSNSDVANDGMLKLVAWQLTGEERYLSAAREDLHYLLGRNATGYCFVTGFGSLSPMVPHNRLMSADDVEEPMPGYIVGGPNTIVPTDCEQDGVVRSEFPAASYTDTECSYSTNETAINWNAPLVFLVSGLADE